MYDEILFPCALLARQKITGILDISRIVDRSCSVCLVPPRGIDTRTFSVQLRQRSRLAHSLIHVASDPISVTNAIGRMHILYSRIFVTRSG